MTSASDAGGRAALREPLNATLSRSDVLRPLHASLGMLALLVVALVVAKAPDWTLAWAACGTLGTAAVEAFAYVYCLMTDRDALRSERCRIHEIAPDSP